VLRRIFSTDHKVIGLQYGFTSLFFLLVGFALVILIRWQHAFNGQPLPFFGALLGLVFFLLKVALVIFAIWFVMRLFRNNKSDEATAD
jgi:heme/copper-type cytochrome/quinol oxidase subunit 1